MPRLAISVEGQTELEFCKQILNPYLMQYNIYVFPVVITTKRILSGLSHKGGSVCFQRVINEVTKLLKSFDYVTTFYDFYRFGDKTPNETPDELCIRIKSALGNPVNFTEYVQVYEFETLLFSDPQTVGRSLNSEEIIHEMLAVVKECGEAEKINDNPNTAPSKRLDNIFRANLKTGYDHAFYGPTLASDIGLTAIRAKCPRFHN
ncbi:MAG: DUF4276 family protein [Nitrospirae bacterium]|nr:DUF4276 family protein [Nitrospirota bacterium]